MLRALLGVVLALAIFFSSLGLLKQTLIALEPRIGPLLRRAAGHPVKGAALGFLATTLIQSSSATNSLAVTMVGTGVLQIRHAFAIILGANVGTTMTAQLVAFGLQDFGLPLFVTGLVAQVLPHGMTQLLGRTLMGIGGLFYGLWALGHSLAGLGGLLGLGIFVGGARVGDLASVAAGAALTAVVQSSSAVTSLLVGLADAGSLPVRAAIGGVLGSNIGTVTTTLLAGIPSGPIARKTALLDLLFNTVGVAFVAPLLGAFPAWMAVITELPGRQVANAHTLFNLVTVALALPWVGPVSRLLGDVEAPKR